MTKKRMVHIAAGIVVLAGLVGAVYCVLRRRGKARPRIVTIEGAKAFCNLSRSWMTWIVGRVDGRPASLPVRHGDVLSVFGDGLEWMALPYLEADGTSIAVAAEKARLVVGGRTVSVALSEKEHCWDWLAKATGEDLAHLRMLALGEDVAPSRMPIIEKIAAANPRINLSIEVDEGTVLRRVLPLFHPRWLMLSGRFPPEEKDWAILASRKGLEVLWIDLRNAKDLAFVARLPDLRRLVLSDWDPEKTGPFPGGCGRLESLAIIDCDMKDLSPIAQLTGLRELHLAGCETLADIGALSGLSALESLVIASDKGLPDLSVLKELDGVTRLGLPEKITQEEFAAAVEALPGLRGLELVECKEIKDLGPLAGLPKLRHLVAIGPGADSYAPLREMKSLRYLVLHEDVFKKQADEVRNLEEALPHCTIAAGGAVCLGSGWILALLPAVGLVGLLARLRRIRAAPAGPRDA